MKKYITKLLLLCCALPAAVLVYAQQPAETFEAGGIKVIFKPTPKQIINVSVYFKGGASNYTADKAGIENLAVGATTECGTANYTKDAFKDKADKYGIRLFGSVDIDYSFIGLNCIKSYYNEGWNLLEEAVMHPAFDKAEFGKFKQKVIGGISQAQGDPDTRLEQLAMENAFAGTPYALPASGTTKTAGAITGEDAKDYYYKTLLSKQRIFIVVVGNVTKEDLVKKITASFAGIPSMPYTPAVLTTPTFTGTQLKVEERKLATNYIGGGLNGPVFTSPDRVPNLLAYATLSDKLFEEIRTKRNLSYAPQAYASAGLMPYAFLYVSTTNPKLAVEVIDTTVRAYLTNGFTEKDLRNSRGLYTTLNLEGKQSTDAIANSLGYAEIRGDWKLAEQFPALLEKTTAKQMTEVFRKYANGIYWVYLGDKAAADEAAPAFAQTLK